MSPPPNMVRSLDPVESSFSGLRSGDDAVLSGRKLGNGPRQWCVAMTTDATKAH